MDYTPPLQYLIRQSFKRFVSLSLITIGLAILVRFYEILFISGKAGYPSGSTAALLYGIQFDLMLALRLSLYLLVPFLFIDHYSQKAARIFFAAVSVIVVVGDVILLRYFSTTRIPLGADLLGYSIGEIKQTVGASGEMNQYTIFPVLLFFLFSIYAFYKWSVFKVSTFVLKLVAVGMIFTILPIFDFNPDPADFKDEFRLHISANKFNLFSGSIADYFRQKNGSAKYELNSANLVQNDIVPDAVSPSSLNEPLIDSGAGHAASAGHTGDKPGILKSGNDTISLEAQKNNSCLR